jgi:glutathione S-transferase
MKLELVSFVICPFVHRAAIMLREKGAAFETRYVDLENKPAWFLAISPRGKVPVLVADGVALFESAAICEFLDEACPPRIMPEDLFARARQRAWVEVANDLLFAQHKVSIAPSAEQLVAAEAALAPLLARFEAALADGTIAADRFDLIHVAVAPTLYRFVVFGAHCGRNFLSKMPRLDAWARSLAERPSVAGTVVAEFKELYVADREGRGSWLALETKRASTP